MTWHTIVDPDAACSGGGHKHLRIAVYRQADGRTQVAWPGAQAVWDPADKPANELHRDSGARAARPEAATYGPLQAPMAARVLAVLVQGGTEVSPGATLVVLEAMKMEHALVAPHGATIAGVHVQAGDQVAQGQHLVTLAPREQAS